MIVTVKNNKFENCHVPQQAAHRNKAQAYRGQQTKIKMENGTWWVDAQLQNTD